MLNEISQTQKDKCWRVSFNTKILSSFCLVIDRVWEVGKRGTLGLRKCKDPSQTKEGAWQLGKSSIPPEFAKWGFCLPKGASPLASGLMALYWYIPVVPINIAKPMLASRLLQYLFTRTHYTLRSPHPGPSHQPHLYPKLPGLLQLMDFLPPSFVSSL